MKGAYQKIERMHAFGEMNGAKKKEEKKKMSKSES